MIIIIPKLGDEQGCQDLGATGDLQREDPAAERRYRAHPHPGRHNNRERQGLRTVMGTLCNLKAKAFGANVIPTSNLKSILAPFLV